MYKRQQLARHIAPDLVLLDIAMPGLTGWETAQHMRRQGYRGPVVMLSANARENNPDMANGLHNDYLTKPLKLNSLLDSLARHLSLTWLHRQDAPQRRIDVVQQTSPVQTLDPALRDELLALAEIGHLTGLRDRIVQARNGGQLDHKLAENMHSLLKVFDFQAAIRLLETTP